MSKLLAAAALILSAIPALAADSAPQKAMPGFAVLGALGLLPVSTPTISYGGWWTPQDVPGEVDQQRLTIQAPIYRGDTDNYALSIGATSLHFGAPLTLGSSGIDVPDNLWKLELGGSYSHRMDGERLWGARVSLGSASDHPFARLNVATIGASAFYSWPGSPQSRWMLTMFFSNNNPLINYVPIPGFVYLHQTKTLIGLFGFPFSSIIWMPVDPWMFTLSIFGPTVNSEIVYGSRAGLQFFTGYSFLQQSFIREDRPDTDDRMYYDEMHVPVGVRFPVSRFAQMEFSVGYSFDRSVSEGTGFEGKQNGQAPLGASWFGAGNLRMQL